MPTRRPCISDKRPGYFTITAGTKPAALRVSRYSHCNAVHDPITEPSKTYKMNLVNIPPYSTLIGRGDLLHCSAAYDDPAERDPFLRYHMYFSPTEINIQDAVFPADTFMPHFVEKDVSGKEFSET